MRQDANISVVDARLGTNAPFTHDSRMTLAGNRISAQLFLSIRVYCGEHNTLPVRIGRVVQDDDRYLVYITDGNGVDIGSFAASRRDGCEGDAWSVLILSDNGLVRGHVTYNGDYYQAFMATLRQVRGSVRLDASDLVLLPFCVVPSLAGRARALVAGGETITSSLYVLPEACVHITRDGGSGTLRIDAARPEKTTSSYGFNWLCLDNVDTLDGVQVGAGGPCSLGNRLWIGGRHVVFRSGLTSNLRVVTEAPAINLEGVLDG